MKFKLNYITISLFVLMVSILGGQFTSVGIQSGWYDSLAKPAWTPDGAVIGIVWTIIFILTAMSALIVWNKTKRGKEFNKIIFLFLLNGFLNFSWSFLFFTAQYIGMAVMGAAFIGLSVLLLIIKIWPRSKLAASLLVPYLGWVTFATYLNYVIFQLN